MSKSKKSKYKEQKKAAIEVKKTGPGWQLRKPLFILAILAAVTSFLAYKELVTPPELPETDIFQWWGSYPIDMEQDESIRPYVITFPKEIVADLRERLLHTRPFTPPIENAGFSYGFNTHFLSEVLDFWKNNYNFEEREKFLNKYNHYVTNIQGLDIHFMHVKPKVPDNFKVLPLLLIHGWPGSIREFYEIIPKLTSYDINRNYVFEVIAPSLPGFGFSEATVQPGLDAIETSLILHELMLRLGHDRYYVQGGDYGHHIGSIMATYFPDYVLGFHTNMPILIFHPLTTIYVVLGSLWPRLIVEPEMEDRLHPFTERLWLLQETGYFKMQAIRPDTLGVALSDSPSGLAAYILDKFSTWTHRTTHKNSRDGGLLNKFSLTQLLDNVMIYWSTNTITSSMRMYAEALSGSQLPVMERIPTKVPTWGIKFKHEIFSQPDFVLRLKYENYLHTTAVEEGGHFAAMEHPNLLAKDIYNAVDAFRSFHFKNSEPKPTVKAQRPHTTVYNFSAKHINGHTVKLKDKYKGKVLIIVNVASLCGFTNIHYQQLNELYETYEGRGLKILAFPCNQFGEQEPGNSKEILEFTKNRGVKFDLFEKIEVNGENAHPLWTFLKKSTSTANILWNFTKFIVDRSGQPVGIFNPDVFPLELIPELNKYW